MSNLPEFTNYAPPCYFVTSHACPPDCDLRLLSQHAMEKTYKEASKANPRLPPLSNEQLGKVSHAMMIQQARRSVEEHIAESRDEIETFCAEFDSLTPPCDFLERYGLIFGT